VLRKLFEILANMGVWIRLNDPRHDPVSESGRAWGEIKENFSLSLQALNPDTVSVLIKNRAATDKTVRIPAWLGFYRVSIIGPDGTGAQLKSYGRGVLQDPLNTTVADRTFPAGKSLSTEIPLAVLYDLHDGQYRVAISCPVPGGSPESILTSNELTITR
jgi:hypothetical protein